MDAGLIDLEKLRIRFEPKYIPEPNTACYLWLGAVDKDGYGQIWSGLRNERGSPLLMKASRASILIAQGIDSISDGECACHRCDNTFCVSPDHLFAGSPLVNKHDAMRKGRAAKGDRIGTCKLSPEEVLSIASAIGPNWQIGEAHGVHRNTVALIKNGETWSHLTNILPRNRVAA